MQASIVCREEPLWENNYITTDRDRKTDWCGADMNRKLKRNCTCKYSTCSILTYATDINIIKENKGRCKESTIRGHRKNLSPDGIRTHDPPCSRSDTLTSELLRTRWRARVIFVGWTCEPHLAVTQSITSNTLRLNCITQSH